MFIECVRELKTFGFLILNILCQINIFKFIYLIEFVPFSGSLS